MPSGVYLAKLDCGRSWLAHVDVNKTLRQAERNRTRSRRAGSLTEASGPLHTIDWRRGVAVTTNPSPKYPGVGRDPVAELRARRRHATASSALGRQQKPTRVLTFDRRGSDAANLLDSALSTELEMQRPESLATPFVGGAVKGARILSPLLKVCHDVEI